ncbi:MAG: flagellar hook-length control protein FliK [Lachnospiraceae bacterium]|nr:flagellar hook-length control protein FliK [Lachnospiraceae bacterium]
MEIKNLINQYYSNVNNNSSQATQPQGVEQLTQALNALKAGTVFEGTVNSIRGSQVLLGLSSGQNITARLLADVGLSVGESVFFQVKKNDGQEITIKPVSIGASSGNPIISDALKSASLPVNDQTIAMVDEMIKNHLPIDSKSIAEMGRSVLMNPEADPRAAVVLKGLGLPVDSEMLSLVSNYKEGGGAIFNDVENLSEQAADIIAANPETLDDVADIFTDVYMDGDDSISDGILAQQNPAEETLETDEGFDMPLSMTDVREDARTEATGNQAVAEWNREDLPKGTIGNTLDGKSFQKIADFLESNQTMKDTFPGLFDKNGSLKPDAKTSDVFLAVKWLFDASGNDFTARHIKSSGFGELLKGIMEDKYTLTPEQIVNKESVNDSYNSIQKDMDSIQKQAAEKLPDTLVQKLSVAAESVNSNVNFVKEVNTVYNYIQIPLKLSNQNATGQLYVYADRKKKKWNPDEPITAFLHFDLENLGSTDISIKLLKKNLDTKFALADDISYDLIENNIHFLQEKLESMGFTCNVTVTDADVKRDFVDDFLKQDVKQTKINGKQIMRYSFDVRA